MVIVWLHSVTALPFTHLQRSVACSHCGVEDTPKGGLLVILQFCSSSAPSFSLPTIKVAAFVRDFVVVVDFINFHVRCIWELLSGGTTWM